MKTYELVEISFHGDVMATHQQVIDDLFAAVKQQISSAQIKKVALNQYRFDKLQNREYEITEWLFTWLCDNSFEPFAVYLNGTHVMHCFRREIEKP